MLWLTGAGLTPLEWASRKGHYDIVRWLCTKGGADATVGTPVVWACYTDHVQIARTLVSEFGADPLKPDPGFGMPALHMAAENGRLDATKWLLQEVGVDPGLRDRRGRTALEVAKASSNMCGGQSPPHVEVVRFLSQPRGS